MAAAAVFLYHASLAYPADGVFGRALAFFARDGAMGVDPFFALSGFVLTWTWRPGTSARSFYRRRFARLAPAYWVALGYGLVWVVLLYGRPWDRIVASVPAVFAIQAWFPDPAVHYAADGPEWSVSAEVFFYALFPVLVAAAGRRGGRRALVVAAILLGAVAPSVLASVSSGATGSWLLNILPATKLGAFVCGIVLAVLIRRGLRIPIRPGVAGVLLLLLSLTLPMTPSWVPQHAILLGAVLLVIAALARSDQESRPTLLASRFAVRLGDVVVLLLPRAPDDAADRAARLRALRPRWSARPRLAGRRVRGLPRGGGPAARRRRASVGASPARVDRVAQDCRSDARFQPDAAAHRRIRPVPRPRRGDREAGVLNPTTGSGTASARGGRRG